MAGSCVAQPLSWSTIQLAATVRFTPISLSVVSNVKYDQLRPGVSYTCISDEPSGTTNIVPYTGDEAFQPGELNIQGQAGDHLLLRFVLPTKLASIAGIGYISLSYDNQSANWVDETSGARRFFNPQGTLLVTLDALGRAFVYLGGNPHVPPDVEPGDEFLGYAIAVAEYAGISP